LNEDTRQRNKGTIKEDCPFKIRWAFFADIWSFLVIDNRHNHPLLRDMSADSSYRSKKLKEFLYLFEIADRANLAPRNIRTLLGPNHPSTSQYIYNQKQKIRTNLIGDDSLENKLLEILRNKNWLVNFRVNEDGKLKNLFMTHPDSVKLARINNLVAVIDSTYKTNKNEFPLLNVVGINCINKTIFIALVAMQNENTDHYQWAMRQIASIYDGVDYPRVFQQIERRL
jgi:hypothetical protein